VNLFQMQLNETALFARRLHCHSVNKPHKVGITARRSITNTNCAVQQLRRRQE
jgi:hypothetical protein